MPQTGTATNLADLVWIRDLRVKFSDHNSKVTLDWPKVKPCARTVIRASVERTATTPADRVAQLAPNFVESGTRAWGTTGKGAWRSRTPYNRMTWRATTYASVAANPI